LQDISPGLALVVVVLVQQPEEFEDTGWGHLGALEVIKPDALAGKADIERDFAMQLALEAVRCHGRATGGAKSTAGRMGVRGGSVDHNSKSQ
jgi:hypothetical protein